MVTLVWWLVANAVVVAALMPIVWLVCRLVRFRPAIQHLLWFLLFIKLIAPPVLDWPWRANELVPDAIVREPLPTEPTDVTVGLLGGDVSPIAAGVAPIETDAVTEPPALPTTVVLPNPALSLGEFAAIAWTAGAAVLLAFIIFGVWRQRSIVRSSVPAPEGLSAVIGRVARKLGLRPPNAVVSKQISTPRVCCIGRPRILWPATMSDAEVLADCDGVVAHELAHLARRDHYWLYAELVVTVCCWWNPLTWILRRCLRETRELACDAMAIAAVQHPRSDYAQRILNLSVSRNDSLVIAPAFGAGILSRRFLKRRLTMVFDDRVDGRVSLGGIVLAALVAALALPGLTLADVADDNQPGSKAESSSSQDQSSVSVTTTTAQTDSELPRRTIKSAVRLSKVVKKDEISSEKPAEISLGSGGIIRIAKNSDGDLVVTVEQTESSDSALTGKAIVGESIGREGRSVSVTTSARPIERGTGAGTSAANAYRRSVQRIAAARSGDGVSESEFSLNLLRSDVELAEIGLLEKQAALEIAISNKVDGGQRKLAELAVRRAEIELRRAKLKLAQGGSADAQN